MMPTLGNYTSNPTIYLDDDAYPVDDDITLAVYLDDDAIIFPPTYFPFSTPIRRCVPPASCVSWKPDVPGQGPPLPLPSYTT